MPRALKNDDAEEAAEDALGIRALIERGEAILHEVRRHPSAHLGWLLVPVGLGALRMVAMSRMRAGGRPVHIEFAFRPSTTIAISLFRPGTWLPRWLKA